jgi:predicted ribosome quality control (RQC) complex YloA/Tae2 family protein
MLKDVMTSFDLAAATNEINTQAEGAFVSKIYQIGSQTLLFRLRKPNMPKIQLLIEAGRRIHLTSYAHETPQRPSAFCMSLRKHLDNGIIKQVKQHQFERIIIIQISTRHGDYQLVIELFGGGNTILVDPEGKILQAMTYKRMRDRNILRGETFEHPPTRGKNPLTVSFEEFQEIKTLEKDIVRALTRFLSISGTYAEEILIRADINKKTKCTALTDEQLEKIYKQLKQLLSVIESGQLEPRIMIDNEEIAVDVTPVPLSKYMQFKAKTFERFNTALDEYYTKIGDTERGAEATKDVKDEVARQQRILQRQKKALENLKEPIIKNKAIGDLIYLNFGDLKSLRQKILNQKRKGKSWNEITAMLESGKKDSVHPDVYFHLLEPKTQVLHVSVDDKIFSLNLRESVQDNANNYYLRSKKAEKKLRGAEKQIEETNAKIEKAKENVSEAKKSQKPLAKRRKKQWYEKFRWFHSSDGLLVLGGRDATTNEILIKKHMEPSDIVFHAEIVGAPFVVIKSEGKPIPEQTISEAAQVAASYSRAWGEMLSVMNVYWVNPEQVSKTPPSGQFLTKGSFMIYGSKNFIRGVSLRVAIGVKIEDEIIRVIGGPLESIKAQTSAFIELVPGDQKSGQLAKKIRHRLSMMVSEEMKRSVTALPIEEFQRFIPLGRGKMK